MRFKREVHTLDREGELIVTGHSGTRARERMSISRTSLDVFNSIRFEFAHAKRLLVIVFLIGLFLGTFLGRPALDYSLKLVFG